jgi:hypothetical protein
MRRTDHVHPAFTLQVAFVSDNYNGDRLRIFDPQDLLMVRLYHLKRVSFRDGVNEEEALAVEHIVLPHRTGYGGSQIQISHHCQRSKTVATK